MLPPPAQDWPCDESEYKLLAEIGHGAFATVYMAFCPSNNVRL